MIFDTFQLSLSILKTHLNKNDQMRNFQAIPPGHGWGNFLRIALRKVQSFKRGYQPERRSTEYCVGVLPTKSNNKFVSLFDI